jgi:Mrp family chromosome partitioning ATPase
VGEGKSLTAINLAISLAREVNHTVLLVDMDLRSPSVSKIMGHAPDKGLADYLSGDDVQLQEIMFNPSIERFVVVPGKGSMQHSSEIMSSPKAVKFIEEIKTRYPSRIVLFDLPPVLVSDDALAFSPNVDAYLMVIEEGKTTREDISRSMDILSDVNIIGTVLNKAESATGSSY